MAAHTATLTKVGVDQIRGNRRIQEYVIDITAAGADGYPLDAATLGVQAICAFLGCMGQENGGYVLQYVPDARTGEFVGDGDLFVYEAGADAAALDEVETGDLGEFRFRLEVLA